MGAAGIQKGNLHMTDSTDTPSTADIDELLAQRRQIAVIWSVEDVQSVREDLSDDQAWQVLLQCRNDHDSTHGITWDLIEHIANSLFPEAAE